MAQINLPKEVQDARSQLLRICEIVYIGVSSGKINFEDDKSGQLRILELLESSYGLPFDNTVTM